MPPPGPQNSSPPRLAEVLTAMKENRSGHIHQPRGPNRHGRSKVVAPYATTGEPLGDAVAELYKVSDWWLREFHPRPEHKQQALQSVERVIGLLNV
jgi:hypothetical protein